jgi:hypothetical protein
VRSGAVTIHEQFCGEFRADPPDLNNETGDVTCTASVFALQ